MAEYCIFFNEDWVPDYSDDDLRAISQQVRAVIAEMRAAGVFVFTGGLDNDRPAFSVRPDGVFADGPYVETKELFGGLCIVDVADEADARRWAAKVAAACTWPQEVRPFRVPFDPTA